MLRYFSRFGNDACAKAAKFLFIPALLLLSINGYCFSFGDSTITSMLVRKIAAMQVIKHKNYLPGLFPSYREYHFRRGNWKDDDNIFFTGLVLLTLREVKPYLDKSSQSLCDSIFQRAKNTFPAFQNRSGRSTYNFWQTSPPRIFPNAGWLNILNKTQSLPDDMDDTAILLMAMDAPDSTVRKVHRLMQAYTNRNYKRHKTNFTPFSGVEAYSTWFGNRVPAQLDVCVLANILHMVHKYRLPYTQADSAALRLLVSVVQEKQYLTKPHIISPHYYRTPIILYHLARLMQGHDIPALEVHRNNLIAAAKAQYLAATDLTDKLILSTALLKWNASLPIGINRNYYDEDDDEFVFFVAGMFSILPHPFFKFVDKIKIAKFYYYCPAYNTALLLETLVWEQRREKQNLKAAIK
jgi:hypothetical protein